jgi:ABC-type branched-chain amino acid transport systems, periplasmic component
MLGISSVIVIGILIVISGCDKKEAAMIKIGAILPLTGEAAKYGQSAKNAIDLAVEEINNTGGINGKKVKIAFEDDQADPKIGVAVLQKLISVDRVTVAIGAMASSVTLAIAPIADKKHIILMSPASTAAAVTNAGDYIFRVCASDMLEGKAMVDFLAQDKKFKRFGMIYIQNEYGVGLKDVFVNRLKELGEALILSEAFQPNETDFRSQIQKLKNANLDGIYVVGYKEQAIFFRQAKEYGLRVPFFATTMVEDPDLLEKAGASAMEGIVYTYRSYDPESSKDYVQQFVNKFKMKYNAIPDFYAGVGYDAARVVFDVISKVGVNANDVKNALYQVKEFPGVTGSITFDENGDVIQPMRMKVIRNGKFQNL